MAATTGVVIRVAIPCIKISEIKARAMNASGRIFGVRSPLVRWIGSHKTCTVEDDRWIEGERRLILTGIFARLFEFVGTV